MTRLTLALTTALLAITGSAVAQTPPPPATPAAPAAPAAQPAPTINSPIEALVANPASKAILDAHLPGLAVHPAYSQIKGMTLAQVAPFSQGAITPEIIAAVDTDLKALPAQ